MIQDSIDNSLLHPVITTDYTCYREQGVAILQRLAGEHWTDHNTHDPGITILEQLCYGLTDLSYRAQYELPDLLAEDGQNPYASIYSPDQILPTRPVTITDLRKLIIDVPGIKNAWIDIVDEPSASFNAANNETSHPERQDSDPGFLVYGPNISDVRIKGLLRVRIEKSASHIEDSVLRRETAQRLHRCRGLGQDIDEIIVLDQQDIRLAAELEIEVGVDASALLVNIYQSIEAYLSSSLQFYTLEQMLQRGRYMDEIFDGPRLEHGFIDTEELAQIDQRTSVHISDLIHELMELPGVIAVKNLRFRARGENNKWIQLNDWVKMIEAGMTPRFDLKNSDIQLLQRGVRIDQGLRVDAQTLFNAQVKTATHSTRITDREYELPMPAGRDRNVAGYTSLQTQFPGNYGIGAGGLSSSAPPARKAQARQLQAYLMFYDQLLANQFSQLANAGKLFSFHDESSDSYFSQVIQDEGTLGLDKIRVDAEAHPAQLQSITEGTSQMDSTQSGEPGADTGTRRRNRFLDHLLARVGEQFHDYALVSSESELSEPESLEQSESTQASSSEKLANAKRAFLRDYPRIGRDRGIGFNYLEPTRLGTSLFLSGDFIRTGSADLIQKLTHSSPDPLSELHSTVPSS